VIHLSIGQPDFPTPSHIVESYQCALADGKTRYTMDAGLPQLLAAISKFYNSTYSTDLTEDNILVTCGASEALFLTVSGLVAPGREVIVTEPAFVSYAPLVQLAGGTVIPVVTHPGNGYQLDAGEVLAAITDRTTAIILNTPGNPTGIAHLSETVAAIITAARERGIAVISDEVYEKIVLDEQEHASVLAGGPDLDHIFFISSVSKTYSMPGMRVGWVISSSANIQLLRRYHMYTTTVQNTPAQWATVAALTGDQSCVAQMADEYRRRRDRVLQLIEGIPSLTGYCPNGAFYILPSLPAGIDGSEVAMRLLKEAGVCVVPGETFGRSCTGALRISFATSMENIEEAFGRMTMWFARQSF